MAADQTCECGQENLTEYQVGQHVSTKTHRANLEGKGFVQLEVNGPFETMPEDLAQIIAIKDDSPLLAAKMLRFAFTEREWPNRRHPESVREFMTAHSIPIFDNPVGTALTASELNQGRVNAIKEHRIGSH